MPRSISPAALELLANRFGVRPVNIVYVQWSPFSLSLIGYADKAYPEYSIYGSLLELADLESVVALDRTNSTSVKVKLSDANGTLKAIFDTNDIHARPVFIYQWFENLPLSEAFIVFEGIIASPIEWSEGDRTLSFEVLSKLEDREVGFSVEEGNFTGVPEELVGVPWPLFFGTIINYKVPMMDSLPHGTTRTAVGIPDHMLDHQLNYIDNKVTEQLCRAACLSREGANLMFRGDLGGEGKDIFEQGQALQRQAQQIYNDLNRRHYPIQQRLQNIRADQDKYDVKSVSIINGNKFIQGRQIELKIGSGHYVGSFAGDTFNISYRRGPEEPIHKQPGQKSPVVQTQFEVVVENMQEFWDHQWADALFNEIPDDFNTGNEGEKEFRTDPCGPGKLFCMKSGGSPSGGPEASHKGKFSYAAAGTAVEPGGSYPIRYILSIIPGTKIIQLCAKRTVGNLKVLDPIPPQYYRISTINYGYIVATIVTFIQPLNTISGTDFDNDVYATMTSPIGPNVVDIITWLIINYTQFAIDTTSFQYVRNKLINYPANFIVKGRMNIVQLLRDIAWQSRCSIWISNGKFHLKYLSEDTTPIDYLNEDDIDDKTLQVFTTETEDLTTEFIAKWRWDLAAPKDNELVYRYNINKYGIHQKSFDFYIYNNAALVDKSAVFWLIRLANVWKKIKCKTFLTKLRLETNDQVSVQFEHPFVAISPVSGIVERAAYNSADFSIDLEIWLPIRLGEMLQYRYAYPAGLSVEAIFPTTNDVAGKFVGGDNGNDGAAGDLTYPGVNYNQFNHSFQKGRAVSDAAPIALGTSVIPAKPFPGADTGTANWGEAINFGNNIDFGTPVKFTDGVEVPAIQSKQQQKGPSYDYRFDNLLGWSSTDNQATSRPLMGKVHDKVGNGEVGIIYNVDIYPTNLNPIGKRISVEAECPETNNSDTIPDGTWVILVKQVYYVDNAVQVKWYFQVPVFLG